MDKNKNGIMNNNAPQEALSRGSGAAGGAGNTAMDQQKQTADHGSGPAGGAGNTAMDRQKQTADHGSGAAGKGKMRKLRHGGAALLLTVAVLAAVIIANYAVGAIVQSKRLYVDMTEGRIYSVSDAADEIISGVGESGRKFEIIFFTRFDEMSKNTYQQQVFEYSKALEEKYDFISLRYIDSIAHPEEAAPYQNSEIPDLKTTDVVITNGEAWQVFKIVSFFTFAVYDKTPPFAFNGEYRVCTALMQMTYDKMLACFTVGHGETTAGSSLSTLFSEAGFEIMEIDLSKDDIPSDTRILVINSPVYDFGGEKDAVNEITKLDRYLDGMGNVMVFEDPLVGAKLTNLAEFLEEWGVRFTPAKVVDPVNGMTSDGTAVSAKYVESGTGSGLTKDLRGLDNPPKTVLADVMPIEILWEKRNQVDVSAVLTSYGTASAYSTADGKAVASGEMPLMTVSMHTTIGENNESYYNYLLCVGTSDYADDKYLNGNVYGNSDIIYEAMRAFCKKIVPVDLDFKVYDDNTLDMTNGEGIGWAIALVLTGPVIAGVIGGIVCRRRKRS